MISSFDDCFREFDDIESIFESIYTDVKLKSNPNLLYISYTPGFLTYVTSFIFILLDAYFIFISLDNFKEDVFYIVSALILLAFFLRGFLDIRKIAVIFADGPDGVIYLKKFGLFNTDFGVVKLVRQSSAVDRVVMIPHRRTYNNDFDLWLSYKNSNVTDLLGTRLPTGDCKKCKGYIDNFLKIEDMD
jgi:hypothetical protein